MVLTCPSLYNLQEVSAPLSVAFLACPDLASPRRFSESESLSLGRILPVS